jgi:hypothetical protein
MIAPRQRLKWAVYALLLADFFLYLWQDVESARHTLDARSGLLEVLAAFVTSIDLVAWFTLILLFELETGVPGGREWRGLSKWSARGLRLACCIAILHTSFAYDIALREFYRPVRLPEAADACAYADGWTLLRNREYLDITAGNCGTIARGPAFYALGDDAVLTDEAGLREGRLLAWTDLVESVAWLLAVAAIEARVRIRRSRFAGGAAATALSRVTAGFYALILAIAVYWGSKGQFLYFWDEAIWVFGFLLIDRNLRAAAPGPALSASPTPA